MRSDEGFSVDGSLILSDAIKTINAETCIPNRSHDRIHN
jgi:hypothetical protein